MLIRASLLAVCALLLSAAPAAAHAKLIASNPALGAALDVPPAQVELTFNEPVTPQAVSVTGPGGVTWAVQTLSVAGAVVQAPVTLAGPAGEYTIAYEVLSGDGDSVRGTVVFTLTAAVPTPTTPPPSTASGLADTTISAVATAPPADQDAAAPVEDGGVPPWVWILGGVVVLVAAVTGVLIRVKRR